mgnify:CR=1 FL=1
MLIKYSLGIKEDVIMTKWRDVLIKRIHKENFNASKSTLKDVLDVKFYNREKEAKCCY